MNQIPAHLAAILAGKVKARAVATIVTIPDRAPVFSPSQSGITPRRSAAQVIEECEGLDCHDAPTMHDNCDPDLFALSQGDAL